MITKALGMLAVVTITAAGFTPPAQARPVVPPPVNAAVDYQLGDAYPLPVGVRVVSRDWRTRAPAGSYGICYLNTFQTQPEHRRWWRTRHPQLLLRRAGHLVGDRNWPGEYLLDITTPGKRRALGRITSRWMDVCVAHGFRAVEPDNLDSWTRSRGQLDRADALAMSRILVRQAHRRGLAVAQKNTAELASRRGEVGWDFAVAEECQVYRECGVFTRAYGARVIEIEYSDAGGRANFDRACAARGARISVLYRDRNLVGPGARQYRFATC